MVRCGCRSRLTFPSAINPRSLPPRWTLAPAPILRCKPSGRARGSAVLQRGTGVRPICASTRLVPMYSASGSRERTSAQSCLRLQPGMRAQRLLVKPPTFSPMRGDSRRFKPELSPRHDRGDGYDRRHQPAVASNGMRRFAVRLRARNSGNRGMDNMELPAPHNRPGTLRS